MNSKAIERFGRSDRRGKAKKEIKQLAWLEKGGRVAGCLVGYKVLGIWH